MRALVYHGPGRISWDTVPDPVIEDPRDAVVRVETATVCGTDLHILNGDLAEVTAGTVLGHEAVGEVVETGDDVERLHPGNRVVVSSVSACGRCGPCRDRMFGQCRGGGGWMLGHLVHGTQAEYVRVPFADHSTHRLPFSPSPDEAVLLAEVLPTAYEVGVRNGEVGPGDTVVVVGAGPVGLATVALARLCSPRRIVAVDLSVARLEAAVDMGADAAEVPGRMIAELYEGPGADVVVEASGEPEGFVLCTRAVRAERPHRRHRHAGPVRHAAPRVPVAQERDHQHRPGRHLVDALADGAAEVRAPSGVPADHSLVPTGPGGRGLRRLRQGHGVGGAEGRAASGVRGCARRRAGGPVTASPASPCLVGPGP